MNSKNFTLMTLLLISTLTLTAYSATKKTITAKKYQLYFGTGSMGGHAGIFSSTLDMKMGKLTKPKLLVKAMRTGILAIDRSGTFLYTSGKPAGTKRARGGAVCAFKIDQNSGNLTLLNSQASHGIGPCYLFIDNKRRNLLVVHYRGGNCVVLPIARDGSLKAVSSEQQHTGSSIHPQRQDVPHPHSIVLDSAGRYAFVADLGLDKMMIYKFNSMSGKITPNKPPFVKVKAGGGPRHFVFHPSGKFAYTNLELTSEVTAFKYDAKRGNLKQFQTTTTLPKGFSGKNANAGISITPDGRFLYVSNRGHNSIAIFSVDAKSGKLTMLRSESTRGDVPQSIKIDPTGSYIIVTDKRAGHVSVFRINKKTGLLSYTDGINIAKVGTVEFRKIN